MVIQRTIRNVFITKTKVIKNSLKDKIGIINEKIDLYTSHFFFNFFF